MSWSDRAVQLVLASTLANQLGHGRRLEAFLVLVKFVGAVTFIVEPATAAHAAGMSRLFWLGLAGYLFIPFLVLSLVCGYGLVANILGLPGSRLARLVGAFGSEYLTAVMVVELVQAHAFASLGFIYGVPALAFAEPGVILFAAANVPTPGAIGNVGR